MDDMRMNFQPWQVELIRFVGLPSAALSICGSVLIMRSIIMKTKGRTTHERLLGCLSLFDIATSLNMFVNSIFFFPPLYDPSTACTITGFIVTWGFAGLFYNLAMSCHFLLILYFQMRDETIERKVEPIMHSMCIGYALIAAIVGLKLKVYNPNPDIAGICWATSYPAHCREDDSCERGKHSALFVYCAGIIPLLLVLFGLIASNLTIYLYVRRTVRRSQKYTRSNWSSSTLAVTTTTTLGTQPQPEQPKQESEQTNNSTSKTRLVATQSLLYVGAFFLCFIWSFILAVVGIVGPKEVLAGRYFTISVLQAIFYPSQGFWNSFIYFWPSYIRRRRIQQASTVSSEQEAS